METTADFIERLRAKYDGASNYRIAQILEISRTCLVRYTKHGGSMSDEAAIRMAKELDVQPAYILACMSAERAKCPETVKVWEQIGAQFAASVLLAMPLMLLVFQEIERGV